VIVDAAIKLPWQDFIYTGRRHYSIMKMMVEEPNMPKPIKNEWQGFINDKGEFLTRKNALIEAKECNQIDKTFVGVLTSENLW